MDKRHAVITFDHYLNKFKIKDLSTVNGVRFSLYHLLKELIPYFQNYTYLIDDSSYLIVVEAVVVVIA